MWTSTILVSRKSMASIVTSESIVHEDIGASEKSNGRRLLRYSRHGSRKWLERLQRGEACDCEEWAGPGATFSHATPGEVVFHSPKPRWNSPWPGRPRPVTSHAGCLGNTEQDGTMMVMHLMTGGVMIIEKCDVQLTYDSSYILRGLCSIKTRSAIQNFPV